MNKVQLLVVDNGVLDDVTDALESVGLGDAAGFFGDNGGEPDGHGPLMARADKFTAEELAAAVSAGAEVCPGWEFDYPGWVAPRAVSGPWCGYGGEGIGFALDRWTAAAVQRLSRAAAQEVVPSPPEVSFHPA